MIENDAHRQADALGGGAMFMEMEETRK